MKKYTICMMLLMCGYIGARTVLALQSELVTAQSLPDFIDPLPQEYQAVVNKNLSKYADLINDLLAMPVVASLDDVRAQHKENLKLIEEETGNPSLATINYVIPLYTDATQTPAGVFIISGIVNRAVSLFTTVTGKDPYGADGLDKSTDMLEILDMADEVDTFQHISRVVAARLLAQNGQLIKPVPVYLVHIPGRPKPVNDNNYIIFMPWADLSNYSPLGKTDPALRERIAQAWNNQAVREALAHDIRSGIIWAPASSLWVSHDDPLNILAIDLEQPNNSVGGPFFMYTTPQIARIHQYVPYMYGRKKYEHDIQTGLNYLDAVITGTAQQ